MWFSPFTERSRHYFSFVFSFSHGVVHTNSDSHLSQHHLVPVYVSFPSSYLAFKCETQSIYIYLLSLYAFSSESSCVSAERMLSGFHQSVLTSSTKRDMHLYSHHLHYSISSSHTCFPSLTRLSVRVLAAERMTPYCILPHNTFKCQ